MAPHLEETFRKMISLGREDDLEKKEKYLQVFNIPDAREKSNEDILGTLKLALVDAFLILEPLSKKGKCQMIRITHELERETSIKISYFLY